MTTLILNWIRQEFARAAEMQNRIEAAKSQNYSNWRSS